MMSKPDSDPEASDENDPVSVADPIELLAQKNRSVLSGMRARGSALQRSGTPSSPRMRWGFGAAGVLVAIALIVAVAVAAFTPRGQTKTVSAASSTSASRTSESSNPARSDSPSTTLFVHVLGAVTKPGLFELHGGARVVDAIAAAGGFAENADQGGVNLARPVSDGEQILVPVIGAPPPAAAPGTSPSSPAQKINLNTATQAELETLPRVGPTLAERILEQRTSKGRFTSVEDLLDVPGIGDTIFDGLRDRVTV